MRLSLKIPEYTFTVAANIASFKQTNTQRFWPILLFVACKNWVAFRGWMQTFQQQCNCRNMSVKPAVRRSPQQRTPQVHQTKIRTLETFKLTYELLNLWFHPLKYLSHHVFINLYLGYVVGTYPPSIHTCNSCRRYVVVTYRPIIFISCRKYVSDTCNSGELILIGTE